MEEVGVAGSLYWRRNRHRTLAASEVAGGMGVVAVVVEGTIIASGRTVYLFRTSARGGIGLWMWIFGWDICEKRMSVVT